MQKVLDFLKVLDIRNIPLVGTLYNTLDGLFDSRRGVLAVSGILITVGLSLTPAAHEVFVPAVTITAIIVLVGVFGYSYTDAKLIVREELDKGDLEKWVADLIAIVMTQTKAAQADGDVSPTTLTPEEAAAAVYGSYDQEGVR